MIFNEKDEFNNSITIKKSGNILLKLNNEKRARHIGCLKKNEKGNKIYYKEFNSKKHIFLKNNSLGVNWYILNKLKDKDKLIFTDEYNNIYSIYAEIAK